MIMKKILTTSLKTALLTGVLLTSASYAQTPMNNNAENQITLSDEDASEMNHPPKQGHRRGMPMKKMALMLDLTSEQQQQLTDIKAKAKSESAPLKQKLKSFRTEMKALMKADFFDEQAFIQLQSRYQPTLSQLALVKAKTKHAMKTVLTVEQREKWQKVRKLNRDERGAGKRMHKR